jgi:Ser/Thr protein kinase RdoA (MazF antagonist)
MSAHPDLIPPESVLAAFDLEPQSLVRATSGLMNPTWYAESRNGAALVLQRVNPVFSAEVNIDIAAVTEHLANKGLLTPRLVPTRSGSLWIEHEGIWRVLTRIDGVCRDALETPEQARAAGRIVAKFHRAVSDLDHQFRNRRLGVHDTPRHLRTLRETLVEHRTHRHFDIIEPLAARVLETAAALPPLPASRDRIVHGDPKISNLLFAHDADRALCLIDLDTLAHMPVALELGDALRSWCNPSGEDATDCAISAERVGLAMAGYASTARDLVEPSEAGHLVDGLATICVELAARFAADALRERYFGWDPSRHPSRGAHNLVRAKGQWSLARSVLAGRSDLEARVAKALV